MGPINILKLNSFSKIKAKTGLTHRGWIVIELSKDTKSLSIFNL